MRTVRWLLMAVMAAGAGLALEAAHRGSTDVLELRGGGEIRGRVLAEKTDSLVVDLGYTVLVVPRREVRAWQRGGGEGEERPEVVPSEGESGASVRGGGSVPEVREGGKSGGEGFYVEGPDGLPVRNVRELAEEVGESVVQVRTPSGLGSGFVLNEEGYLLTNFHVIEGENDIRVEVFRRSGGQLERTTYRSVRIVALNKFFDLALLKIEDAGAGPFRHVRLGSSRRLAVGERVFAVGSPLGLERTVTEGIVSTKTRELQGVLYLQTTAPINPGNSGGPLFDMRGLVVGVTNMKITFGEGLGFAIPVERVKEFLENREAFAYDNSNPNSPYRYLPPPRRGAGSVAETAE
ncbi:S1C family serine protease [Limisphaera sp. 4302-co]|uniref:S1C family serine protease n=1 Tax=Limisphaera sp. 4302-co TaxID=3400417 RepID=UPI003C23E01E